MHLALECPVLRGLPHEGQDLVHVEGLGHIVVGAALDGLDSRAHVLDRRDDDHGDAVVEGQDLGQKCRAGGTRHAHVEEDHVHPAGPQNLEPPGALGGLEDLELFLEDHAEGLADARLVVDHEHDGLGTGGLGIDSHGARACPGP
jgi:hypothetical protein